MKLPCPIEEGKFIKRYKRFFADIDYQNKTITAHVPNTGSMKNCTAEAAPCRFSVNDDPKRKLKYTLHMIKAPNTWIGVNTNLANDIVWEAWLKQEIPHWREYKYGRREVKISDSTRFDMAFWQHEQKINPKKKIPLELFNEEKFHFVEVKNVTLAHKERALFPDAVTTRGQKHLQELMDLTDRGHSCEILFLVQRTDCKEFAPADDIDPLYGKLLRKAYKKGVRISAYPCKISKNNIKLIATQTLKVIL